MAVVVLSHGGAVVALDVGAACDKVVRKHEVASEGLVIGAHG